VQASITLLSELATLLLAFAEPPAPDRALGDQHLSGQGREVLGELLERLRAAQWTPEGVKRAAQEVMAARSLKMPQVMMPLRVAVTGREKTPDIVAIVAALKREVVLERIERIVATR
ncbi:MAG: glutamate--tRNA ligase, partial [Azospira oryzae]